MLHLSRCFKICKETMNNKNIIFLKKELDKVNILFKEKEFDLVIQKSRILLKKYPNQIYNIQLYWFVLYRVSRKQ